MRLATERAHSFSFYPMEPEPQTGASFDLAQVGSHRCGPAAVPLVAAVSPWTGAAQLVRQGRREAAG
jgi:hypothetical protein